MSVTIYHNPACGTSRNTLAMIRQSGEEPEVIEYVKHPPSRARLVELIQAMGITARELLREKGTPYAELGLADRGHAELLRLGELRARTLPHHDVTGLLRDAARDLAPAPLELGLRLLPRHGGKRSREHEREPGE